MNTTYPVNSFTSIKNHLIFISLLMGVGFSSSGIITWVAANWSVLSNSQKLYGTQGLFLPVVSLLVFFFYKKQWRSGSQGVAFLSAVVIGGLLALSDKFIKQVLIHGNYLLSGHYYKYLLYSLCPTLSTYLY
ncbi:hypothetical protein V757_10070 [Pelistega indica]|uniref:DUF2157 domain-containing protein n=1 Tax=Pelistega indica TaxID=1414851 RepID=V8FWF3_9BURK|nr:DUF2157 domain-containing protein [Pelistega indica]ETD68604.1 hypothetical protein V757_10070 [Pelistega indica]